MAENVTEMGSRYKITYEVIYRVRFVADADRAHFSNETLGLPEDWNGPELDRARLALAHEVGQAEEEVYLSMFDEAIQSEGPDGFFFRVAIVDAETGQVVEEPMEHVDSDFETVQPSIERPNKD